MYTNNSYCIERFDSVIAKVRWCRFLYLTMCLLEWKALLLCYVTFEWTVLFIFTLYIVTLWIIQSQQYFNVINILTKIICDVVILALTSVHLQWMKCGETRRHKTLAKCCLVTGSDHLFIRYFSEWFVSLSSSSSSRRCQNHYCQFFSWLFLWAFLNFYLQLNAICFA